VRARARGRMRVFVCLLVLFGLLPVLFCHRLFFEYTGLFLVLQYQFEKPMCQRSKMQGT
jgi:hypothetical protein